MQTTIEMFFVLFIPAVVLLLTIYSVQHLNILIKKIGTKSGAVIFLVLVIFGLLSYILIQSKSESKQANNESNKTKYPSATVLWDKINDWETQQGYKPYLEDVQLCAHTEQRLVELKSEHTESNELQKIRNTGVYSQLAENSSRDVNLEMEILNKWLSTPTIKRNLEEYYQYSCVRCEQAICVQLLANFPQKTQSISSAGTSTATDPLVDCTIGQSCGTMKIRKSECQTYAVCCEVGSTHVPVRTLDECIRSQTAMQNQSIAPGTSNSQNVVITSAPNRVPVFLKYGTYTRYCPEENISAIETIDSVMMSKSEEWAKKYNTCADTYMNSDSCYVACKGTFYSASDQCVSSFGYSGAEFTTCSNQASNEYSNCMSKCPSTSKACDWVYSAQKDLLSQINNLCKN